MDSLSSIRQILSAQGKSFSLTEKFHGYGHWKIDQIGHPKTKNEFLKIPFEYSL